MTACYNVHFSSRSPVISLDVQANEETQTSHESFLTGTTSKNEEEIALERGDQDVESVFIPEICLF